MTVLFVEILVQLLILLVVGKRFRAQLYLSPTLSNGEHPGHPWLVVLGPSLTCLSRQDLNVPSTLKEKAFGSDSLT